MGCAKRMYALGENGIPDASAGQSQNIDFHPPKALGPKDILS
jgi:hypothetical protein